MNKAIFIFILAFCSFLFSACNSNQKPSFETVYEWSETTLNLVPHENNEEEWATFIQSAVLNVSFDAVISRMDLEAGKYDERELEIDTKNRQFVRNVGIVSSIADYCELDFDNLNFLPMMQWQRDIVYPQNRQGNEIKYLGFAHGFAMGTTDDWLEDNSIDCDIFSERLLGNFFEDKFG